MNILVDAKWRRKTRRRIKGRCKGTEEMCENMQGWKIFFGASDRRNRLAKRPPKDVIEILYDCDGAV